MKTKQSEVSVQANARVSGRYAGAKATDLRPHLLSFARYPHLPETLALAGTMALAPQRRGRWRSPVAGLGPNELDGLLVTYFPAAAPP